MKKILVVILFLLSFPSIVLAKDTCNNNDIKIESIELNDTRGNVEEVSSPNNKNNKINLNTKMNVIGDNITYKVVVKNTSNSDYTFDKNMLSKDYLSYDITYEDNSNIIKPNEEKVIYLRLSYDNKPEIENLVNGVLKENSQISFNLNKTSFINPETRNKVLSLIYLFLLVIICFYLIKKKKTSFTFFLVLAIIPHIVNATCVTTLDINLDLEIDGKDAIFLPGAEVNIKMKQLAGDNATTISFQDQNIIAIKKGETEPNESNKEEKNLVSVTDSLYPIYMWYEEGTIYWWSEDGTPALNENSQTMFYNLQNLVDIDGISKWDAHYMKIMEAILAKTKISNLLSISNWNVSNVTNANHAFYNNSELVSLEGLEKWNTKNVTDMSCMFSKLPINSIKPLKDWNVHNLNTIEGIFESCPSLISLEGLENWDTSKVTNMEFAFNNCTSLSNIDAIKDWNVKSVVSMKQLFCADINLIIIDLSNWETPSLENMINMFAMWNLNGSARYDAKLRKIIFSDKFNTSNVTHMEGAFTNLLLLEEIEGLEYWDTSKVTNMSYMFGYCKSLTNLDLNKWNTSNVTDMSYMFTGMLNLEELDISSFNTKKVTTFARMFNGSTKLKHIYIGENWSTEANTGETEFVFPTTCELPNFSSSNPNCCYLSYAHAGEGGYLTLKTE